MPRPFIWAARTPRTKSVCSSVSPICTHVLAWADEVPRQDIFRQQPDQTQQRLQSALMLAHKILADREPKAKDKVLSIHDPDARRGMHCGYYEGYLLDIAMDADSEIITATNVLPANGDEGMDAAHLIKQEERRMVTTWRPCR